jgi:hypothetical protein
MPFKVVVTRDFAHMSEVAAWGGILCARPQIFGARIEWAGLFQERRKHDLRRG